MTDPVFQISNEALRDYDDHGALMAKVHENLIESLVQRDNDEMMRLFSGKWEPPQEDSVGLFQQRPASFHDNEPPDQDAVKKQLQEKFANKLGTRTPESAEIMARAFPVGRHKETVVVPRKNGKKSRQEATQAAASKVAGINHNVGRGMVASSHTHGAMQSKTQVSALNIKGRDVEECTQCGALVLDTAKHRAQHKADNGEMNALLRQLADARGEIRALKEAKTKRVPRPKKYDRETDTCTMKEEEDGLLRGHRRSEDDVHPQTNTGGDRRIQTIR